MKNKNNLRMSPFLGVAVYLSSSDSWSRTVDSLETSILTINFFKCSTASAWMIALSVPGEAVKPRIYKVKNDHSFLWFHTICHYLVFHYILSYFSMLLLNLRFLFTYHGERKCILWRIMETLSNCFYFQSHNIDNPVLL
jgi:hypothetical protein